MSANTRYKDRYARYYASLHWKHLTNAGPDAEPNPCGPSIEALTERARRDHHQHADAFDPRFTPSRRAFRSSWIPLNFH